MDEPPKAMLAGLEFSSLDIIKMQSAIASSLCAALDASGLIPRREVAGLLAAQVRDDEQGAWAQAVRALALSLYGGHPVLGPAQTASRPPIVRPRFKVIEGGHAAAGRIETAPASTAADGLRQPTAP